MAVPLGRPSPNPKTRRGPHTAVLLCSGRACWSRLTLTGGRVLRCDQRLVRLGWGPHACDQRLGRLGWGRTLAAVIRLVEPPVARAEGGGASPGAVCHHSLVEARSAA